MLVVVAKDDVIYVTIFIVRGASYFRLELLDWIKFCSENLGRFCCNF